MKTHYTIGYGGKLNYYTTCGKEISSHSETETASIDPTIVNCVECKNHEDWKDDFGYCTQQLKEEVRRIFIESDILLAEEIRYVQKEVRQIWQEKGVNCIKRVFLKY